MSSKISHQATIYTDGSCHTKQFIGAWVAILFIGEEKVVLTGVIPDTTHNRMELTAVIEGIKYIRYNYKSIKVVNIISDSQYVIGISARKQKLVSNNFITKKGTSIPNADLVTQLLELCEVVSVEFIKIKAHLKKIDLPNYNIEADQLSRKIVREAISKI